VALVVISVFFLTGDQVFEKSFYL